MLRFIRPPVRREIERIYLVAASGHPNYGDDLIARVWLRFLAARRPHAEVWLDCPEPGRAAMLFRDEHPRLRTTNTLWQMVHQSEEQTAAGIGTDAQHFVRELGSPKVDVGLLALRQMQTIHLLGGGYINGVWPQNVGLLAAAVEVRRMTGARVALTGHGFLPLADTDVDYVGGLLRETDYAEARDAVGAELLGVRHGVDDAFLDLSAAAWDGPADELPDTMVLVQHDFLRENRRDDVFALVRRFLEQDGATRDTPIGFCESIPPHDRGIYDAMRGEFPAARFFSFREIWERGVPARAGQRWFSTRYHFHMLAAARGARGVALDLQPSYYGVKHGLLVEMGTGWTVVDADTLTDASVEATGDAGFPSRAAGAAAEKRGVADLLYPRQRGLMSPGGRGNVEARDRIGR